MMNIVHVSVVVIFLQSGFNTYVFGSSAESLSMANIWIIGLDPLNFLPIIKYN